jgi:hypothetical protein
VCSHGKCGSCPCVAVDGSPWHLPVAWWVEDRKHVIKERRKAFDSSVIAVAWSIWFQRNERSIWFQRNEVLREIM